MANLIITVIAIALVAVASLMGAYYGGSAFLNNQSAAAASTALNQGQQVQGAWSAYLSDNLNTPPASASVLVSNNYLASVPTSPAAAGGVAAGPMTIGTVGGHYFAWADVGAGGTTGAGTTADSNATACERIIKTAAGGSGSVTGGGILQSLAPGAIYNATTAGAVSGNGTFGCAYTSAATPAGLAGSGGAIAAKHYVMEYLLQ